MGIINHSKQNVCVFLGHNGDVVIVDNSSALVNDSIVVEPNQELSWGITLEDRPKK